MSTEFCLENIRHGPALRRKRDRVDGGRGKHDRRYVRSGRVQRRKSLSLGLKVMAGASSSSSARTHSALFLQHCSPFATARLVHWDAWRETINISLTCIHRVSSLSVQTLHSVSVTLIPTLPQPTMTSNNNNHSTVLIPSDTHLHLSSPLPRAYHHRERTNHPKHTSPIP